jgi:hypothetical protein
VRHVLGGLAHEKADHRVGETLHDADHRREQRLHREAAKQGESLPG